MKTLKVRLSHVQIIALGFLILIAVGTALLSLPFASADGEAASFGMALFTSVSAATVTGFTLGETVLHWSGFGQAVILLLFQTGGLGVMTIATLFFMLMRRRVGLRQREVMVQSLNSTQVGGVIRLLKEIIIVTAMFELLGTILLSFRFVPLFGLGRGLWYGFFHSVSAFCNAGFDLMGGGSMSAYRDDWYVNLVLIALIIFGGLGFIVLEDIFRKGGDLRRYSLQSKIVLSSSGLLAVGGALLFWLFERGNVQGDMSAGERLLTALFSSVTARNAGFMTVDASALSSGGRLLMMLLMFIGGSPGSTSGGVKTTTVAVVLIHAWCSIRHEQSANIFGRRIESSTVSKAVSILACNIVLVLAGVFAVLAIQPELPLAEIVFEIVSAIGTAGISCGVLQQLNWAGLGIMMGLMFLGRLGSVSFAVALLEKKAASPVQYPAEKITIG